MTDQSTQEETPKPKRLSLHEVVVNMAVTLSETDTDPNADIVAAFLYSLAEARSNQDHRRQIAEGVDKIENNLPHRDQVMKACKKTRESIAAQGIEELAAKAKPEEAPSAVETPTEKKLTSGYITEVPPAPAAATPGDGDTDRSEQGPTA